MLRQPKKKCLSNFKIASWVAGGMLLATLIPSGFIIYINNAFLTNTLTESTFIRLQRDINVHATDIDLKLENFEHDLIFLSNTPPIQGIIRSISNEGKDPVNDLTYTEWTDYLATLFEEIEKTRNDYLQIRYIDQNGQELVRVDSNGTKIYKKTEEELQNKKNRYYFQKTMQMGIGEVYISPIDLNREGADTKIEIPYKPVIRYGTPIFDEKTAEPKGIIIINVNADILFNTFTDSSETQKTATEKFVINNEGYYLVHPNKNKEWGSPRDLNTEASIKDDFPEDIVPLLLSGEPGKLENSKKDYILNYSTIYPNEHDRDNFLVIIKRVPKDVALRSVSYMRKGLISMSIGLGIWSILFSFFFSWSLITHKKK